MHGMGGGAGTSGEFRAQRPGRPPCSATATARGRAMAQPSQSPLLPKCPHCPPSHLYWHQPSCGLHPAAAAAGAHAQQPVAARVAVDQAARHGSARHAPAQLLRPHLGVGQGGGGEGRGCACGWVQRAERWPLRSRSPAPPTASSGLGLCPAPATHRAAQQDAVLHHAARALAAQLQEAMEDEARAHAVRHQAHRAVAVRAAQQQVRQQLACVRWAWGAGQATGGWSDALLAAKPGAGTSHPVSRSRASRTLCLSSPAARNTLTRFHRSVAGHGPGVADDQAGGAAQQHGGPQRRHQACRQVGEGAGRAG